MLKIILKIDGMACSMCEAHINDAFRRKIAPVKVFSSHSKGETVIISKNNISDSELNTCLAGTGYNILSVSREPYEKKSFRLFKKKQ